uniref:Poly [ADP-ribose] polymerase n=1 Tax=Apteryx owenii TaxID=8824 RepID=A0A8B9Q962_APTOW
MTIFSNCVFFLKLKHLPIQEKNRLKTCIKENGGVIHFVLDHQCTHVVVDTVNVLSSHHLKIIRKYQLPVVCVDFIWKSVEKGKLLQIDAYEDNKLQDNTFNQKLDSHENDQDIPFFPQDFEVAKYNVLEKVSLSLTNNKQFIITKTAEEIRENYEAFIADLKSQNFLLRETFPPKAESLASTKLQKLLLEEAINSSALCQEVSDFVELIWAEALGHLDSLLLEPVKNISLNDVSKAEGILLQIKNALDEGANEVALQVMIKEFYQVIRHKTGIDYNVSKKLLSSKQDLCQLIRDMLNIRETNMSCPNPSSLAKYQALRCKIEAVDSESYEFLSVKEQLDCPVRILQVYRVSRIGETAEFLSSLGNIQSLFHASPVRNFVGILCRGLLMPKVVVEDHGLERTDAGNLGSGIYFSDSISASVKYSSPSVMDGTRLLAVCDVALGSCLDLYQRNFSLNSAPSGYDSVHGVHKTTDVSSDFEDDEFVVYKTNQVKIRYVVKFCVAEDHVKPFQPGTGVELEQDQPVSQHPLQHESYALPSVNLVNAVKTGLQDRLGNLVPLKSVNIKGRIIDFVAQVVMFQTYTNQNSSPIEAKYVFPLDDKAAVCGFEAFINGKHIIGEVKEKKQAHREYSKAISQGDGAYLMDQDAPDIFVISVGNLPPDSTVLIKISYITELSFHNGCISFHLPASVSPWQQDKALNENTQKTDCKAVIKTVENSSLDVSGFALEIWISQVYLPRMWVEKHPNKRSEACMLVFQPEFVTASEEVQLSNEIIICLDCSNSMAGSALQQAKQIALHALELFSLRQRVNVVKFGTNTFYFLCATATLGNTDLWKTLRYFSLLFPSQGQRNILVISDGHIQNESVTFQIVKDNVQHTRLFTCGVGSTANRHMLRSLAQYGAGAFEYFDPKSKYNWEEKIQSQVSRMFSPGCSSVSIKWQQFDTNAPEPMQAPAQIQSLFNNERLLVYGFILHSTQMKKQILKNMIIRLSLENSIITQFTSFVAVEKRDANEICSADVPNLLEIIAQEDVDFLPYMDWEEKSTESGFLFSKGFNFDSLVITFNLCSYFPQLGKILKFDVDYLINDFLIGKGIQSLGQNGKEKILQLIATLLVLQFIRCTQQLKGIVFKSLMKLDDLSTSSAVHWAFELIKKAVEWVRRVERRFPAICYRLELGKDWDSATKEILGINDVHSLRNYFWDT